MVEMASGVDPDPWVAPWRGQRNGSIVTDALILWEMQVSDSELAPWTRSGGAIGAGKGPQGSLQRASAVIWSMHVVIGSASLFSWVK